MSAKNKADCKRDRAHERSVRKGINNRDPLERRTLGLAVTRPKAVKVAEKLASLTLVQVLRRRKQFARRAAQAKYRLEDLSPNSLFRGPIQAVQDANIFALKQAEAEIKARELHARGQLSQS